LGICSVTFLFKQEMSSKLGPSLIKEMKHGFMGEIYIDEIYKTLYATDASVYREKPLAVALPKSKDDIIHLIHFASKNKLSIIPRAAGTSLAGQVVGNGIVVDISKYFTRIIEINVAEKWARVQAGVVRDELNLALKPHGLMFGPETSTGNRCMIGGMLGNNACGAHSLVYGSTRDHTLEVTTILSDGSEVVFKPLTSHEFEGKTKGDKLENKIYQHIQSTLGNIEVQKEIENVYPDPEIERRNTAYALDLLLKSDVFGKHNRSFNFSKLLAGSEGTLAFTTEIKLNLVPLPPQNKALVCVHLHSVEKALKANLIALQYNPVSIELMDKAILDLTKTNKEQDKNRFFVEGDPGAILIVEFAENNPDAIIRKAQDMENQMKYAGFGYHFPIVKDSDIEKVWNLRKAGLGVLSNMPGDAKPLALIEDTAVHPKDLPDFIADINQMLERYGKSCVFYAHIATGELHLRPILNLKDKDDVELFYEIAHNTAVIVKKYRGSLSGEHGDGRLRGAFIPLMMGDKMMQVFEQLKDIWDPLHIFNPGKIVRTPPMNKFLRYEGINQERKINTIFRFDDGPGILRTAERCNGSGDCRKTSIIGGTMCPSYQATRDEKNTTRARANILREFLSRSDNSNPFDHDEIYEVMDLCLSCKACKSECPSNVDVSKLKAEFLQHYYDDNGVPLRSRLIANITSTNRLASIAPEIYNSIMKTSISKLILNKIGFAKERSLPDLYKISLAKWFKKNQVSQENLKGTVFLFNDEFTNYYDTGIGIKTILLLQKLGYQLTIPNHVESGRSYLSKGLLRKAKKIAERNVELLAEIVSDENPLIGVEPSTILSFRDEYPDLVNEKFLEGAKELAKNTFTIEEFLANELRKGNISKDAFTSKSRKIVFHGHCQQKALNGTKDTIDILSVPANYTVAEIPSGCCGMAGSFGYEKEHYELSMKVGEMVLFPSVRSTSMDTIIAAPGTSCRHQIKDGTNRTALHPVEILFDALK
jgi:FAD/FMN-containing dehydrogenase/Fe-S oxidoreductase